SGSMAISRAHSVHTRKSVAQLAAAVAACDLRRGTLGRRLHHLDFRAERFDGQATLVAAADRELAGSPGRPSRGCVGTPGTDACERHERSTCTSVRSGLADPCDLSL